MPARRTARRGFTLVETLLAVGMTALVGGGIVGMMSALTDGMAAQHDMRSSVIRAGLAQGRLTSYLARSRCLLDLESHRLVLWLEDADGDKAIDGDEVRWIGWSNDTGSLSVRWVVDETGVVLDEPHADPAGVDWWRTLDAYERTAGLVVPKIDLAGDVTDWAFESVSTGNARIRRIDAMSRRSIQAHYSIAVADDTRMHSLGDSIRMHRPPDGALP